MSHSNTPADLGESEPPHIKNWYSSYEYESFVLETNDNFGFSEHQGSQGIENVCTTTENTLKSVENLRELATNGKDEGVLIKCNQSDEESKCQKQVLESQDSPLLSPEPLGIENWFSSYAYESPEVDTIDDLIVSDLKESMVDRNEKGQENLLFFLPLEDKKDTNYTSSLFKNLQLLERCEKSSYYSNGSLSKIKESEKGENLCVTPDDLVCKRTSGCENSLTKDDKNSTELDNDDANVNSVENGSIKLEEPWNGFVSCLTKDDKNSTDLPNSGANVNTIENGSRKLEEHENGSVNCSTIDDENSTDLPNSGANVNTFESGSRKLEEPEDGFVSIKSKKENYEKSKRVKGVDRKRCIDSPVNKMKKSDERVTLGDVTNIVDEHSSVTGKWKCPRKRKPDIGPPLKQLRLGRWFHHV